MKEHLVIFESDIDRPQWFVVMARSPRSARIKAEKRLWQAVGDRRYLWFNLSLVVSR